MWLLSNTENEQLILTSAICSNRIWTSPEAEQRAQPRKWAALSAELHCSCCWSELWWTTQERTATKTPARRKPWNKQSCYKYCHIFQKTLLRILRHQNVLPLLAIALKGAAHSKKTKKKHCCSKSTLPFKSLRSIRFLFLTFFKKSRTKAALIWSQKYIEKYHYFKTNNFSKYILQWQAEFFQQPLYYSFQCHMIFRNRSSLCKSLCRFIFLWKRFFYEQTLKEGLTLTFDQFNSSLLNTSIKEILRTTNYSFKYLSISNLFFACKVVRVENL